MASAALVGMAFMRLGASERALASIRAVHGVSFFSYMVVHIKMYEHIRGVNVLS
jgi:hypothetical protein